MTKILNRAAVLAVIAAALLAGVALAGAQPETAQPEASPNVTPKAAGIDPRSGGFQVALGEWSVGMEAKAIRPGLVTIVVTNRGKFVHGLEIERVRGDDEDSDSKIDEETEDLGPGQTARLTLNLTPGVYEIECSISNHDDLGMFIRLEVRADAPLLKPAAKASNTIAIRNFAYAPKALTVRPGTTVKWKNADAAPHTVTGQAFSSQTLNKDGVYSRRFTRRGTYAYLCALHPAMKASVIVK